MHRISLQHAILTALVLLAAPGPDPVQAHAQDPPVAEPPVRAGADAPKLEAVEAEPPASEEPAESGEPEAASRDTTPLPMPIRFRLADGVRVAGSLEHWDLDGIDGSFGRRGWAELQHHDARRLLQRLLGTREPEACADLGAVLLRIGLDQPDAIEWAERAFARAERLALHAPRVDADGARVADDPPAAPPPPATGDGKAAPGLDADGAEAENEDDVRTRAEQIADRIADARAQVDLERILRLESEQIAEAERLRTDSPEGRTWRADPWPPLTDEEQAEAAATMREDAHRILARAGLELDPIETDYFLFYSDMPDRERRKWARELDRMYHELAAQFGLMRNENIFWGKAVVFVFNERDRFRLVEAEAFGQLVANWVDGIFHPLGPKVFVNFYRQRDDAMFAAVLVHETVHGFMHRYRTPYRLPTWANEGLADYLASILFRGSPVDLERRAKGLSFIRRGANIDAVLDMSYHDGSWPGPDSVGYYVGYLLVELMIRDRGLEFARWVEAIKEGTPWQEALLTEFGTTRAQLVDRFVRFYRVND